MGNLDGRIAPDKEQAPVADGGTKDGPTGMATKKAPVKHDGDQPAKAPDVIHSGDKK